MDARKSLCFAHTGDACAQTKSGGLVSQLEELKGRRDHTHTHALLKDFTPTSGRSLPRAPLPQAEKNEKRKKEQKKGNGDRRKGKKEGRRKWSLRVGVRRRAGRQ